MAVAGSPPHCGIAGCDERPVQRGFGRVSRISGTAAFRRPGWPTCFGKIVPRESGPGDEACGPPHNVAQDPWMGIAVDWLVLAFWAAATASWRH